MPSQAAARRLVEDVDHLDCVFATALPVLAQRETDVPLVKACDLNSTETNGEVSQACTSQVQICFVVLDGSEAFTYKQYILRRTGYHGAYTSIVVQCPGTMVSSIQRYI